MPLSAKKVAASYGSGGLRVPRAPLISCLTCPLCGDLFREATTVSECLHTFCRDCIQGRLSDGETNSCPMCNVSLGTLPLEKLRTDHQLDDVKAKLFPDDSRKRKYGPGSSPAISAAPIRRKERSLYSLGIGAQPQSVNPGFATRATRGSPGKSVAVRDTTSSEEEEDEDEEEEDEEDEEEADEGEEQDDEEDEPTDAEEYTGKEGTNGMFESTSFNSHGSKRMEVEHEINDLDFIPFRPSRPKEEPRRAPLREPPPPSSDTGIYLARRSVLTANGGVPRTRSGNCMEPHASAGETGHGSVKGPANGQDGRGSGSDNLLATLAEVAEASGTSKASRGEQPQPGSAGHTNNRPDVLRGRDSINHDAKSIETRPSSAITQALESTTLHASPPRAKRSSPQLQRNPSLKLFVNGALERPAILMHPTPPANGSLLPSTSFAANSCGIWFALQAARNQADNPLPQLSSPYLRIKDGKLPVSHVKKYLVKKLGLSNETEVEITCRGQPVVSSLPLESVRNIWFATASAPNTKDQENQGQAANETSTGLMHLDASSAKELIMVLTYQRHRRNTRIC